jgi:hypothetical protein
MLTALILIQQAVLNNEFEIRGVSGTSRFGLGRPVFCTVCGLCMFETFFCGEFGDIGHVHIVDKPCLICTYPRLLSITDCCSTLVINGLDLMDDRWAS